MKKVFSLVARTKSFSPFERIVTKAAKECLSQNRYGSYESIAVFRQEGLSISDIMSNAEKMNTYLFSLEAAEPFCCELADEFLRSKIKGLSILFLTQQPIEYKNGLYLFILRPYDSLRWCLDLFPYNPTEKLAQNLLVAIGEMR